MVLVVDAVNIKNKTCYHCLHRQRDREKNKGGNGSIIAKHTHWMLGFYLALLAAGIGVSRLDSAAAI
jgi:hypothetical protein